MNDTDRSLHQHVEELTMPLRMRDLPPERIGEVLAEVEAHLADTGESPTGVFGSPRKYAERFENRAPHPLRAHLLTYGLIVALIFGPTLLLGRGIELSQSRDVDTRSLLVVVAAMVATALVVPVRRPARARAHARPP